MSYLLDTQVLLWAAVEPRRLSARARKLLEDERTGLAFSAASLWEIVIKRALGRTDFDVDPRPLRRGLLDSGYRELPVLSEHVIALDDLPALHKDPFDRILVAQAGAEGMTLLTGDARVAGYPGPIRKV